MDDGRIGVILYVEDDLVIRLALAAALQEAGFAIVEVDNGRDALATLEREAPGIRGLITDVNLGGEPDGWAIARQARELIPTLPIVYVSAEAEEAWAANGVPNSVLVPKPFAPAQVVVALSMLLNTPNAG